MKDKIGREIDYLRISITNQCNLHCRYCAGSIEKKHQLTADLAVKIAGACRSLGIRHIRLTGGEPTVHPDFLAIIEQIKQIKGIESITVTTNGMLLSVFAESLKQCNVDWINVSLDTIEREQYKEITGSDSLKQVLEGIDKALSVGLKLRINSVILPNQNWYSLAEYAEEKGILLRFIERMPFGEQLENQSIGAADVLSALEAHYGLYTKVEKDNSDCHDSIQGNGPACYYQFANRCTPVGLISAIGAPFCATCNRIRITADCMVKPCLCYDDGISFTPSATNEELVQILQEAILKKPQKHCFNQHNMDMYDRRTMQSIGG